MHTSLRTVKTWQVVTFCLSGLVKLLSRKYCLASFIAKQQFGSLPVRELCRPTYCSQKKHGNTASCRPICYKHSADESEVPVVLISIDSR